MPVVACTVVGQGFQRLLNLLELPYLPVELGDVSGRKFPDRLAGRAAIVPKLQQQYGGPDALRLLEEECPEPKDGEVRVRVLAGGVCLPDIVGREGVHPETPPVTYTLGWDLVGEVDRLGSGVSGIETGRIVAAMPIHVAYAEFICLPRRELVPVPSGLDGAEAVSLILNYVTAYQMLHRSTNVKPGQRVLFHGASGGVGTALLQLGRLAELEMYGTCSPRAAPAVSELGGVPIDYRTQDFVRKITASREDDVDAVFDPIGAPTSGTPVGLGRVSGGVTTGRIDAATADGEPRAALPLSCLSYLAYSKKQTFEPGQSRHSLVPWFPLSSYDGYSFRRGLADGGYAPPCLVDRWHWPDRSTPAEPRTARVGHPSCRRASDNVGGDKRAFARRIQPDDA